MQALCANEREEFISTKLKKFYDRRQIRIKNITPYILKKNGIAK